MVHDSWLGVEFFALVARWDAAIAQQVAAGGCPRCGGPLHQGNYLRKPRGGLLASAGEASQLRHSLCCGRRGCRRRALPPSLRFLGRRVYVEAVVVLGSVFAQLASLREARAVTGVPGRTLRRWGEWWRGRFPTLGVWAELRARFVPPPPDEAGLPRSLVARIGEDLASARRAGVAATIADVMLLVARCLAPVTTSSVPDAARFTRDAVALAVAD